MNPRMRPPPKSNSKMIIVIIMVILLIGIIGGLIYYASSGDSETGTGDSGDSGTGDSEPPVDKIYIYSNGKNYIGQATKTAPESGWTLFKTVKGSEENLGTGKICSGYADNRGQFLYHPTRDFDCGSNGWTHIKSIYTLPEGTKYCIDYKKNPWRYRLLPESECGTDGYSIDKTGFYLN